MGLFASVAISHTCCSTRGSQPTRLSLTSYNIKLVTRIAGSFRNFRYLAYVSDIQITNLTFSLAKTFKDCSIKITLNIMEANAHIKIGSTFYEKVKNI